MENCFVIMPFNKELNALYENCYKPVIESNGLVPNVLIETRNGSPIYFQIINNIQTSKLIIADLTIARPNCYFEVGYTIGYHGKQDNLILCCREDHIIESSKNPRHNNKGVLALNLVRGVLPKKLVHLIDSYLIPVLDQHKIHFDLAGYPILWWGDDQDSFKMALDKEIKQRLELLKNAISSFTPDKQTEQSPPQNISTKLTDTQIKRELDEISQSEQGVLKNVKK